MTAAAATVSDQPEPHRPAHRAGCQRATAAQGYPQRAEAFEQGRAIALKALAPSMGCGVENGDMCVLPTSECSGEGAWPLPTVLPVALTIRVTL
jgi:hypothetical protein